MLSPCLDPVLSLCVVREDQASTSGSYTSKVIHVANAWKQENVLGLMQTFHKLIIMNCSVFVIVIYQSAREVSDLKVKGA